MAKVLQFRRGTTAELASITGAVGELFVDTTKDTVVVHDGSTQGGFPLQRELVSGTSIKTINGNSVLGSGNIIISGGGDATWGSITGTLSSQTDLQNALNAKQNTLVSGTNIKTINGTSVLGSGNIIISGDGAGFDQSLNTTDNVTFASVTLASELLDPTPNWFSADYSPSSPTSLTPQISVYFWNAAFNSFVNSLNTGDKFSVFSSSLGWVTFTFVSSVSIPSGTAINVEESIPSFSDIPSGPGLKKIVSNPVQPILVSGTNIKTINGISILGSGDITISGGSGGDLSEVSEDILPSFSDVYDIGSEDKRWYDGYFSNKVDISGVGIIADVSDPQEPALLIGADVIANSTVVDSSLIGTTLYENSLITPEVTSAEYVDTKGTLVVDGSLKINDNLTVRNNITLRQEPVQIGTVVDKITTPSSTDLVTISGFTNFVNNNLSYFSLWGTYGDVYLTSGQPTTLSSFFVTGNTFTIKLEDYEWTMLINNAVDYGGWISLQYTIVNTVNVPQWATNGPAHFNSFLSPSVPTLSISANAIIPAKYSIVFDKEVPDSNIISKILVNDSEESEPTLTELVYQVATIGSSYIGSDYVNVNAGTYTASIAGANGTTPFESLLQQMLSVGSVVTFTAGGSFATGTVIDLSINGSQYIAFIDFTDYNSTEFNIQNWTGTSVITSLTGVRQNYTQVYESATSESPISVSFAEQSDADLFNIGDVFSYVPGETSIRFTKDDGSSVKAITFNNDTGEINYDGLPPQAISIDPQSDSIRSTNSSENTNGVGQVIIGSNALGQFTNAIAIGTNAIANNQSFSFNCVAIGNGASSSAGVSLGGVGSASNGVSMANGAWSTNNSSAATCLFKPPSTGCEVRTINDRFINSGFVAAGTTTYYFLSRSRNTANPNLSTSPQYFHILEWLDIANSICIIKMKIHWNIYNSNSNITNQHQMGVIEYIYNNTKTAGNRLRVLNAGTGFAGNTILETGTGQFSSDLFFSIVEHPSQNNIISLRFDKNTSDTHRKNIELTVEATEFTLTN